ncbi:hypothetical protein GJ654_18800 [Rhodoblastus acidophilus]|uniref:Phage tail tube protein n=1 Tax=Rhodoblastus acidophilus TaxID=1074 RepID=A0A6N8DV28_RHOAC|nr:phage tail tube protein [Rhodoblastus acidophilus]MCW2276378.1 hypothetical protein [Rhodoblastus acidophilus]MTV33033.1 hypothetical protein [Rhodoblastus acidophilus]
MDNKGGRVSISINGVNYSPREASVKISPTTVEMENGANGDGTGYSTVKPVLAAADISFDRGQTSGIKWDNAMLLADINVTVNEMDTGVSHLLTSARWSGRPELDTATGEITGLKVETDKYQAV